MVLSGEKCQPFSKRFQGVLYPMWHACNSSSDLVLQDVLCRSHHSDHGFAKRNNVNVLINDVTPVSHGQHVAVQLQGVRHHRVRKNGLDSHVENIGRVFSQSGVLHQRVQRVLPAEK